MTPSWKNHKSAVKSGAVCFVLGAVAGCALGATVTPLHQAMTEISSETLLKPLTDGVRNVGSLGLGTLLGATALSATMASAAAGVTLAASVTLLLLRRKKSESTSGLLWIAAGLTASLSTTSCGAALGFVIEKHVLRSGVEALLWALAMFTVLKAGIHIAVKLGVRKWSCFSIQDSRAECYETLDVLQAAQRERVTVEIEQMTIAFERSSNGEKRQDFGATYETQRRNREEKEKRQAKELAFRQMSFQEHLNTIIAKYVDFLTFSDVPLTVSATVTAGLGILGFGDYRFVFIVLLALVLWMAFMLTRSMHLNFWMFTACVGMFATFSVAVLTVHAGQEVLEMSARMRKAGQVLSKEGIAARMAHKSALEAVTSGFFVAKMFQIALGATVGGLMDRKVLKKVVIGASVTTIALLLLIEAWSVALGIGGVAGALLGALGAAGVSTGAAAAAAVQSSSWIGAISTMAGMLAGALAVGNVEIANVGLQVLVGFIFAVIKPY